MICDSFCKHADYFWKYWLLEWLSPLLRLLGSFTSTTLVQNRSYVSMLASLPSTAVSCIFWLFSSAEAPWPLAIRIFYPDCDRVLTVMIHCILFTLQEGQAQVPKVQGTKTDEFHNRWYYFLEAYCLCLLIADLNPSIDTDFSSEDIFLLG